VSFADERLAELTRDLAAKHLQLGTLMSAEREGRLRAYEESEATSVSAADRYADLSILPLSKDIIMLKAEIKALEVEWEWRMGLLTAGTRIGAGV